MKPKFSTLAALGLVAGSLMVAPAQADLRDPLIRGAKQCTQHFPVNERIHGIPSQLLAAISNTESGRWNKALGMVLPWPWTINAEGKGYYFNSKAEAIRKVKALRAQGMKSIDIGCMQVNLKHHPNAFASIEQAFDPRYNVAYAARFLKSHYDDMKDWNKAIAAYHSKTPKYGNKYLARVQKSWDAITGKVRIARAMVGREEPARDRLTYRVIQVRDEENNTARSSSDLPEIKRSIPKRKSNKSFEIAMREEDSGREFKGMALRPQDRLSTGFRQKRIAVTGRSGTGTTIVRPTSSRQVSVQDAADQDASVLEPSSSVSDLFVTQHGAKPNKKTSGAPKPKFIFVE